MLVGSLADQAALYGVLLTLADLAVPLVSLEGGEDSSSASDQASNTG